MISLSKALILSLILMQLSSVAWAWPPTFGAEFEFTRMGLSAFQDDPKFATVSNVKQEQLKFTEAMRKECAVARCQVTEIKGKWDQDYRVTFEDGWYFTISYDPGCVEITFKPSTGEDLKQQAGVINKYIFGTAQNIGLYVDRDTTAHFNIGIRSAFEDDGKKFARFFADYANHVDLSLGSLGVDTKNAPSLSIQHMFQRAVLAKIIDQVNSGELTSIADVAHAIHNRVYVKTYYEKWAPGPDRGPWHYQAIGLKHVVATDLTQFDAPMEMRAIWNQENAEKFELIGKLFQGRIKYLNAQKGPVIYTGTARSYYTASELRARFYIYVEEAGMKDANFESLLPPNVRETPLDDFVNPKATAEQKLQRIEEYWDLIPVSEWARKNISNILTDPSVQQNPLRERLLRKMEDALSDPQEKASKWDQLKSKFTRSAEPNAEQRFETKMKEILRPFYRELAVNLRGHKAQSPSCESVFKQH